MKNTIESARSQFDRIYPTTYLTELQIVFGPEIQIEGIAEKSPTEIGFLPLASLRSCQKGTPVDVIGRILKRK